MRITQSDSFKPQVLDIDGDGKSSPIEYLCYIAILTICGIALKAVF